MKKVTKKNRWMFNLILIHVARTWERVRMEQEYFEMPQDNLESADDAIPNIAQEIFDNDIIQGFLNAKGDEQIEYWDDNTEQGMSDWYIEAVAEEKIKTDYLN